MPDKPSPRTRRERVSARVRATPGGLTRSLEHPVDRTEARRGPFERFAERMSFLASSPVFFLGCAVIVAVWLGGVLTGASDRFVTVLGGLMSAVTLILVAVLKNSELRAERAVQTKLDAIASALLEERRGHEGDAEEQLERSIGVHEQI